MQYQITDKAAIEFCSAFYESLADGLPVDAAVTEARVAVSMDSMLEWGIPVLYMRSRDGRLFDISTEKRPSEQPLVDITDQEELLEHQERTTREKERKEQLDTLYARARRLHQDQDWHAVVDVFEQISEEDQDYPDDEGLLQSTLESLMRERKERLEEPKPEKPTKRPLSSKPDFLPAEPEPRQMPASKRGHGSTGVEVAQAYAVAQIKDHQPDDPFLVRKSYVLQAGVRRSIPEDLKVVSNVVPISLPKREESIQLDVVVHTEDMEISPAWIQTYSFSWSEETQLLSFVLKPTEPGYRQIRVEFIYQRHWLAKIQFEVEVLSSWEAFMRRHWIRKR